MHRPSHRPPHQPSHRWVVAVPLALSGLLLLSACGAGSSAAGAGAVRADANGSGTPAPGSTPAGTSSAGPSAPGTSSAADLAIRVTDGAKTTTWTLTCDATGAAGGDHPQAQAACAALAEKGGQAVPAVAKDKICSQLFGGVDTAVVTGTWAGRAVRTTFDRKNGCEVSRWDALVPLLPAVATSRAQ